MREFVEFLGSQSPYDRLGSDDLDSLAQQVEVVYYTAGTTILTEDDPPSDSLYVIRTGAVELLDAGVRPFDLLSVGDSFGYVSMFSGRPLSFTVRAVEDTLCYRLPDPRGIVAEPHRLRFSYYEPIADRRDTLTPHGGFARLDRPVRDLTAPPLWCTPTDSISGVAQQMTEARRSCAVFLRGNEIGIVTDADFRARFATGNTSGADPIESIASVPAVTIPDDATVSAAFLFMVDKGIHHLITTDPGGTPNGVARVVDIAASDVRDPLVARSAIATARSSADLVAAGALIVPTVIDLWHSGVPALHLGAIYSTMVEALIRRTVELTTDDLFARLECCWLLAGSHGRREPLLNSDVDTALIWYQPTAATGDPPTPAQTAAASEFLIDALPSYGLSACPQGLNASNRLFNRSVGDWHSAADSWRRDPGSTDNLLLASTMLDARPIGGHRGLEITLRNALTTGIGRDTYVRAMIGFAGAERPPSGFVREFVVGHIGDRKRHLNIKKSGLRPIAALARTLALRAGDATGSTTTRLDRAHASGLLTTDEADTLTGAFTLFYQLVLESQVHAVENAEPMKSAIEPSTLDTLERRNLRAAFRSVNQIQDRLAANRYVTGGS
ncbi:putative nucleotidyltransferase substrate binding domain-containing protein [Gordonia sp. CPCC 205515]|uniref:putative nucleotidyltransferase substrate binding domain-containing protein n=1 Tax=Gordonia sp. CPCC 205515 TaxID=3140791 RepID=UPI003AF38257